MAGETLPTVDDHNSQPAAHKTVFSKLVEWGDKPVQEMSLPEKVVGGVALGAFVVAGAEIAGALLNGLPTN